MSRPIRIFFSPKESMISADPLAKAITLEKSGVSELSIRVVATSLTEISKALDGVDAHPVTVMSVTSATDSALVLIGVILAEISPT